MNDWMVTVDVVKKPTWRDYAETYAIYPALVLLAAFIVWRKMKVR
jgi:hypothetical protein